MRDDMLGGSVIRRFVRIEGSLLRLLVIAVLLFAVMSGLEPDRFLTVRNFTSMSFQFPELGLFAIAIMLSLLTGGIDLSVVSAANLAGISAALVLTSAMPENPSGLETAIWVSSAVLVAVAIGAVCGFVNGLLIARAGITPILATLGTMQLFTGLALVLTKGTAISGYPPSFLALGNGTVLGIPVPLLIFAAVAATAALVLHRTRFGICLYLMGTSETAARYAGIPVRSMLIRTYLLSGLLAAIAGLVMIARTNSAKADYGTSYLLQAVLVAILGGVGPSGGFGTIGGLVLAVISLQFLSSGFGMLRLGNYTKEFAWGALLLGVMVLNDLSERWRVRRRDVPGSR